MATRFNEIERPLRADEIEKLLLEAQNLEKTLRRVSDVLAATQKTNTRLEQLCSCIRGHIETLIERLEANEDGAATLAGQSVWGDGVGGDG